MVFPMSMFPQPEPDFDDADDADVPFALPQQEQEESAGWPAPGWPASAGNRRPVPLPVPTPPTGAGKRHGCDYEHRRQARERQAALRRQQEALQHQLWRLDAQEAAISAQWAALPQPPSPLMRIVVALAVLGSLVALLHFFPLLLVPLIVVLLIMAKARRYQPPRARSRHGWAKQERERLESRWHGIAAERAVLRQQLASIQSELSLLAP